MCGNMNLLNRIKGGAGPRPNNQQTNRGSTFYEPIFMKFSGNAHNTMPYILRRSLNSGARGTLPKYMLARINNVNDF